MAYRTNDEGEIEEVDLPVVHTELLMLRGTPEGDWYYPSTTGLFHGPFKSKEIAMIEYYRMQHAELTGECYVDKFRTINIEAGLRALGKHEEAAFFGTNFSNEKNVIDLDVNDPNIEVVDAISDDIAMAFGVTKAMALGK